VPTREEEDLFMQNSGHLSADRWRTHYARTNVSHAILLLEFPEYDSWFESNCPLIICLFLTDQNNIIIDRVKSHLVLSAALCGEKPMSIQLVIEAISMVIKG
jgi:hypothetical protein